MSERFSNSTKSKAFRYGNNKTHELAKDAIKRALKSRKFETFDLSETKLRVMWYLSDEYEKNYLYKGNYIHCYDIFAHKLINKNLRTEVFIEVDGMKLHSKEHQKKRDRLAETYANFFIPDAYFIRIDKSDVIGRFQKLSFDSDEDLVHFLNVKIREKYRVRKDLI